MVCPACGSSNIEAARFCNQCGAPLVLSCPACGKSNPAGAKSCLACSAEMQTAARPPRRSPRPIRVDEQADADLRQAERRRLTVLFCDLVDSTEITSALDPEDWSEILTQYHRRVSETVERFGGHVALYLGDGLLAFFGYPQAHEDDSQRAVLAGLALVNAVEEINGQSSLLGGRKLATRVGIHCGPVVVASGSSRRANVFGAVPNVASRVQSAAPPNSVLITGAVHHLVSGMFVVEDLGVSSFKGIEDPVQLYRVLRTSGQRGRLAIAAAGLTPFVGREDELSLLSERWERTRQGEGQLVLIIGEPGIGKSRLIRSFRDQIADVPHTWGECAAAALHQNSPFFAVEEMLRQGLRLTVEERPDERLTTIEAMLEMAGLKLSEAVPLIAPLMNVPVPSKYPSLQLEPDQRRKRLLATITAWALGSAKVQPLVVVCEDLHWSDPSTLELIQLLAEQCSSVRMLLICTGRPEFRPAWPHRPHHTELTLGRLSFERSRELVQRMAPLANASAYAVAERSGGVPLFIEELTRSLIAGGDPKTVAHEIPVTLNDSLMARLDRLGEAREVAQVASVIGQEFSWKMLRAVTGMSNDELNGSLRSLTAGQLLHERGIPPDAHYSFRHALIGEAAYQSLLRSTRQQYHRKIAEVIAQSPADSLVAQPQLLAHHYTEAGDIELAIPQWQMAGQMAIQRSANVEAINHLTKALEMLKGLPQSASRAQQELALQITLSVPLMHTKGYASPEVETLYSRARELYNEIGESPQFFPMLFGMWAFYSLRAQYKTARELCEQLVNVAQSAGDPALLIEAHAARGNTLSFLGEFLPARKHLEQAIALYDPEQYRSHAFVYAQDPGVHSLSYATLVLWLLGYPDQARKRSLEALSLAQELSHPFSLAFALIHVIYVHRFFGEAKAAQPPLQELLALSAEHGFPITLAAGAAHLGWALAEQGRAEEGIKQIRQGIDTWRATGSTLFYQPFLFGILAEAYWKAGLPEDGLTVLTEALDIVNQTGERFWEAELYRLKGELTLQSQFQNSQFKGRDGAEECFREAIEIARRQNAKSLELRAVMSLSRLWWTRGKKAEARQMLSEIYGWFTEGFDTADLKAARMLLKEAF
jgi:predicted ATPase/class 3 adenylate cyclase